MRTSRKPPQYGSPVTGRLIYRKGKWLRLDPNRKPYPYKLLPNQDNITSFQKKLDNIGDSARSKDNNLILVGDFNSRAVEWESKNSDNRLVMKAQLGMMTANTVSVPTFRRPGCEGTIVTFTSKRMTRKLQDWKVLEIYTASELQYVSFCLIDNEAAREESMWNHPKIIRE